MGVDTHCRLRMCFRKSAEAKGVTCWAGRMDADALDALLTEVSTLPSSLLRSAVKQAQRPKSPEGWGDA